MPLKIFKRGSVWHFSGTVAGMRLLGTTGSTNKQIAQRIAEEKENAVWNGRFDGPGAGLTMAQAFMAYLDAGKSERFIFELADYWRDTPVQDVNAGAIRKAAINLYPTAANSTKNRHVIVPTQAAINHCAELEWCNPIRVRRFKVETKPKEVVTDEWVTAFEAEASPHLGALCRFMFETAACVGEAVALTWADVDLLERKARIRQTKLFDERDARITPRVLVALANLPSNRKPDEPVFKYQRRDSVRQPWLATIERAGIKRMTAHSCRHGFATAMLRDGLDPKTVARWGGWKDVRVLLETYAHAIEDPTVVDQVFDTKLTQQQITEPISIYKKRRKP